jgi:hypothetical protein
MTTYDAQKLCDILFGQYTDEDGLKKIQEFLDLHDLEHAHVLAEKLREVDGFEWALAGQQAGHDAAKVIDPLPKLLGEHNWDETIFGGFICDKCTPDDPGWDEAVAWPCKPLRAAGLTDERAVKIIQDHRERIEAEHKAKQSETPASESHRSPKGGFKYSVGMIFAHTEVEGVYARVDGFDQERDQILFSVWEVESPGWSGGAGLETCTFAQIYLDGPYTQELVDQATEDHQRSLGR